MKELSFVLCLVGSYHSVWTLLRTVRSLIFPVAPEGGGLTVTSQTRTLEYQRACPRFPFPDLSQIPGMYDFLVGTEFKSGWWPIRSPGAWKAEAGRFL